MWSSVVVAQRFVTMQSQLVWMELTHSRTLYIILPQQVFGIFVWFQLTVLPGAISWFPKIIIIENVQVSNRRWCPSRWMWITRRRRWVTKLCTFGCWLFHGHRRLNTYHHISDLEIVRNSTLLLDLFARPEHTWHRCVYGSLLGIIYNVLVKPFVALYYFYATNVTANGWW